MHRKKILFSLTLITIHLILIPAQPDTIKTPEVTPAIRDMLRNDDTAQLQDLITKDPGICYAQQKLHAGNTLSILMTALVHRAFGCTKLLINSKADVNFQSLYGQTALMYAVKSQSIDCVRLLVEHGADLYAKNAHHQTAADSVDILRLRTRSNSKGNAIRSFLEAPFAKEIPITQKALEATPLLPELGVIATAYIYGPQPLTIANRHTKMKRKRPPMSAINQPPKKKIRK